MKLYEIANEYQQAFDALNEIEGLSHEVIADSLAAIGTEFEEKAKAVAAHIQNLEAEARELKIAMDKIDERQNKAGHKIESLKKYLLASMKACDKRKISTPEFCVSIRKNPPRLILEEDKLSEIYVREEMIPKKVILKDEIKEALERGAEVHGARLEQGERLHFD